MVKRALAWDTRTSGSVATLDITTKPGGPPQIKTEPSPTSWLGTALAAQFRSAYSAWRPTRQGHGSAVRRTVCSSEGGPGHLRGVVVVHAHHVPSGALSGEPHPILAPRAALRRRPADLRDPRQPREGHVLNLVDVG